MESYVPPPHPGFSNVLYYDVFVLDWGNCPNRLSYTHQLLNMPSEEFEQLGYTARVDQQLPKTSTGWDTPV